MTDEAVLASKQKSSGMIALGIVGLLASFGVAFIPEYWHISIIVAIFAGCLFIGSAIESTRRPLEG